MTVPGIRRAGPRAILVELPGMREVHRAWRALSTDPIPGVEEVVPGRCTLMVVVDPCARTDEVEAGLGQRLVATGSAAESAEVVIPVCYDGADLEAVAAAVGLDVHEVARLHAAPLYTVAFVGFSPGFAYLTGTDPRLSVPRLSTPRTSVPAGSVALAAGLTAVYPSSTPGGWHLIGTTSTPMFDPARQQPCLVSPGDRVRFRRVERLPPPPPRTRAVSPKPGTGLPSVVVVDPGPFTTVQDGGRAGWAHLGVPRAGPADAGAAERANALVGNRPGAAVLEGTLAGPRIRMLADRAVAVTGAVAPVTVDGFPARTDRALPLKSGSELSLGSYERGMRAYVAVEGGLECHPVLGSSSTDTLSGLGPPPVIAGTVIALGDRSVGAPRPAGEAAVVGHRSPAAPAGSGVVVVNATAGPRDDRAGHAGMAVLATSTYAVGPASDRTGIRLQGPAVPLVDRSELPSEGMVAGAVQIPPDGQPIVLMRNHPTTGGYPVVAVVDDEGVDLLAQCRPGTLVRIEVIATALPGVLG